MLHANILTSYWSDIFESIVFITNRLPSSSINFQTPYFLLYNKEPDYKLFKVLGCKYFPCTRPITEHKLSPRSAICAFLGYSPVYKGYKCLNLSTNKIIISRHVLFFYEFSFPFKQATPTSSLFSDYPVQSSLHILPSTQASISQPALLPQQSLIRNESLSTTPPPIRHVYARRSHNSVNTSKHLFAPVPPSTSVPIASASVPIASASVPTPVHSMITRSRAKNLPTTNLTANHPIHSLELDPTSYTQASKHQQWRNTMGVELNALAKNQTWTLVPVSEASARL
jgi:hypothetical protein